MAAQTCGAGFIDRIRLDRAPHMKFRRLLVPDAQGMGRALEYFCREAKKTDSGLARALAK